MEFPAYIIVDCAKRLRRVFDERVRDHGVTGPQGRLLLLIRREPRLSQKQYADHLEVEPITLCRMVDRLEDAGLVTRHPDPVDRRVKLIDLSEKGAERVTELYDVINRCNQEIMQAFAPADRARIEDALQKLYDRIMRMGDTVKEGDD